MKICVSANKGKLDFNVTSVTEDELNLVRKALISNWWERNFSSDEEAKLSEDLVEAINRVLK